MKVDQENRNKIVQVLSEKYGGYAIIENDEEELEDHVETTYEIVLSPTSTIAITFKDSL